MSFCLRPYVCKKCGKPLTMFEGWTCLECEMADQESCTDAVSRILKRMWNCRGKHTTSIDKVKMEQIIRDELPSVNPQPCDDTVSRGVFEQVMWERDIAIEQLHELGYELGQKIEPCTDAVSRDFQIGDEVRIIGSDPIYDDCDVGWVIRNASEKIKTMYVMRNDGSAGEENKAEWYKTGRHNAMLAEVIKALPSVTQKSVFEDIKTDLTNEANEHMREGNYDDGVRFGLMLAEQIVCVHLGKAQKSGHWKHFAQSDDCSLCGYSTGKYGSPSNYCPNCGAKMVEPQESEG